MALLSALLLAQAATTPTPAIEIPEVFRGSWNMRLEECEANRDPMRRDTVTQMTIDATGYVLWESGGDAIEIFRASENDIRVAFAMSGEGETWRGQTRFVLDEEGDQLFVENLPRTGELYYSAVAFYHRCPAAASSQNEK